MDPTTDQKIEHELLGRRLLWQDALFECRQLLFKAEKAEAAAIAAEGRTDREAQRSAFSEYISTLANDSSQVHHTVYYEDFVSQHPDLFPFPQPADLLDMRDNNRKLAIIAFMRIWNKGFPDSGKVAGNLSAAAAKQRESILSRAFSAPAERSAFDAFLMLLRDARDSMLAHSDGPAAQAHHEPGLSSIRQSGYILRSVDFSYWRTTADKLWAALASLP